MALVLMFRFTSSELAECAAKQLDHTVLRRSRILSKRPMAAVSESKPTTFDVLLEGVPADKHGIDATDIAAISAAMAMFQGQFAGARTMLSTDLFPGTTVEL